MTYHQITLEERYHLQALRGVAPSLAAIARVLGRHRSTIGRELRRHRSKRGPPALPGPLLCPDPAEPLPPQSAPDPD